MQITARESVEAILIIGIEVLNAFSLDYLTLTSPQVISGGVLSTDQVVRLPRNAVVRSFPLSLQAGAANWIRAGDVAEVRVTNISGSGQSRTSVTLDFGGLRTVSAVGIADSSTHPVIQVKQWTGMGFADQAVVIMSGSGRRITSDTPSTSITPFSLRPVVDFPSEVRTERLQVDLIGGLDASAAGEALRLLLPDLPADFSISVDGGAPVWTAPGPVRAGVEGWSAQSGGNPLFAQTVDLSEALTALLADPSAAVTDEVDLRITLASRQPGVLILNVPDVAALAPADAVRYLTRAGIEAARREVVFEAEGLRSVPLTLDPWATGMALRGLRLTVSGAFEPERVQPALGPDYPLVAGAAEPTARAEMVLDPDRAAAVSLGDLQGQDGLVAVRLPLKAETADAEVQVLLLESGSEGPGPALEGGSSEPVSVQAQDHDTWYTFGFGDAVEIDPLAPPAVAVAVTRGRVAWALSTHPAARPLWHGPIEGPWQALPSAGGLSGLGGRIRVVTRAGREAPTLAPIGALFEAAPPPSLAPAETTLVPVTPGKQPATVEMTPSGGVPAGGAGVTLVARAIGRIVLEDAVVEVGVDSP